MDKVTIVIDGDRSSIKIDDGPSLPFNPDMSIEVIHDVVRDHEAEIRSGNGYLLWKKSGKHHIRLSGTWFDE